MLTGVRTAPQTRCMRVHSFRIDWIEYEEIHHAAQVEHAPGTASIMGDVGAAHVAGNQDGVGVVRTYRGIEHRTPAARSDDAKPTGSVGESSGQASDNHNGRKQTKVHRFSVDSRFVRPRQ